MVARCTDLFLGHHGLEIIQRFILLHLFNYVWVGHGEGVWILHKALHYIALH